MMANFNYDESNLYKPLKFVIGENLTIEEFGLTTQDYLKVDEIEFHLGHLDKNAEITDDLVQAYEFRDLANFKDLLCRAHLWNNYCVRIQKTVSEFLIHYRIKAAKFHPNDDIPNPSTNGNLLDYLKSYKIAWLISIGW